MKLSRKKGNPQLYEWDDSDVAYSLVILIPQKWWSLKQWKLLHDFMRHYKIWFTPIIE